MRLFGRIASAAVVVSATAAVLASVSPAYAGTVTPKAAGTSSAASVTASGVKHIKSCASEVAGSAHCLAILSSGGVTPNAASPTGYGPADLQSAYNLVTASALRAGKTIAIVDAYDDPNAEADLAVYRTHYGLPACTTANGCFKKVNQNGGPAAARGRTAAGPRRSPSTSTWSRRSARSARSCWSRRRRASFANLGAAVNRPRPTGRHRRSATATAARTPPTRPTAPTTTTRASPSRSAPGDSGYGVEYPASSHYVTAVGGTTLTRTGDTARGWTETAWSGAGSGCSAYNAALTGAARRYRLRQAGRVADVSAVADPNTGVAVYDSFAFQGFSGWLDFGGTSVSAPIIAGVYALAGNTASITNNYPYKHTSALFDVTSGTNGSCSPTQWCTAGTGWDGPTGLGTPNGTGGF